MFHIGAIQFAYICSAAREQVDFLANGPIGERTDFSDDIGPNSKSLVTAEFMTV